MPPSHFLVGKKTKIIFRFQPFNFGGVLLGWWLDGTSGVTTDGKNPPRSGFVEVEGTFPGFFEGKLGWWNIMNHLARYIYIYNYIYIHTYILSYLHYITLHYFTLHYFTLHYITLHTYICFSLSKGLGVRCLLGVGHESLEGWGLCTKIRVQADGWFFVPYLRNLSFFKGQNQQWGYCLD